MIFDIVFSITAFPTVDSSFTLPQVSVAQLGQSSPPLYCGFKSGTFGSKYTEVDWWKGITKLDLNASKYELLPNFTLVVHDVQLSDVSNGYFCRINVYNPVEDVAYINSSPDVGLKVYSKLTAASTINYYINLLLIHINHECLHVDILGYINNHYISKC